MKILAGRFLLALFLSLCTLGLAAQENRAMEVTDIMKFQQIESPSVSQNGLWVVHAAVPDRGDPRVLVYSSDGQVQYEMAGSKEPLISNDGLWIAAVKAVPASEQMLSAKEKNQGSKTGMLLLNTSTGEEFSYENVKSFTFSNNSRWLIYHHHGKEAEKKEDEKNQKKLQAGSTLTILELGKAEGDSIAFVSAFALDSISQHLAYVVADTGQLENGIYSLGLSARSASPLTLYAGSSSWAGELSWNSRTGQLAFLAGVTTDKGKKGETGLYLWRPGAREAERVLSDEELQKEWKIWHSNKLQWSKDGQRLFLGTKPGSEIPEPEEEKPDSLKSLYSSEDILAERTVDVWHWNDPYINTHQKKRWESEKNRTYTGVYYPDEDRFVQLADPKMPDIRIPENPHTALGSSSLPYAKRMTWDGRYSDYYLVNLSSGKKELVLSEQQGSPSLSPDGKYLSWYEDGDWYLMDAHSLESRNLTSELEVPFADEDWDYPEDTPGYGVAGWLDSSEALLLYDKYDIWQFPAVTGSPFCLTGGKGREEKLQFRIRELDLGKTCLESGEQLFLSAYHDLEKYTAVYQMKAGKPGVSPLSVGLKKYNLLAKSKEADLLLFTRQSYTEYPDLWVTDLKFRNPRKLSDLNAQTRGIAWGEAELVEWSSLDGTPLQGILIKPGNYEAGKKYPVLVYYYRFFSNRLYDFNRVELSHRPCFPFYASNGYAIFLPDIRFDIGNPGYSATKCLVPGVQKLIDSGIADPGAICLHGHSWSGYQTAFAITRTDLFTCAIAGAPVANMTSAYSGIRWGSGLARQFQYEKSQSRIGGSLWEARDLYIENSPVFFADRIETPLLIMFGDEDDAVPWYQGIELYLAMRRLEKECHFLQYRDEPHHPRKYANKLDCTLKYKEYLDHYLKGEPAADWILTGVPYKGK
ncbi:MAG: prolyl oligopeptidase family serine peptidase [Bacteroidales bacterium]|nr:prolyl oligopeptidase family serine peptidase [Bacteroidales bacterium]